MNDRQALRVIYLLAAVVLLLVIVLNRKIIPAPEQAPYFVRYQPLLHAIINGTCAVLLMLSFYCIKNKKIAIHKKLNLTAFALSFVFLVSYVIYHYFVNDTRYPDDNPNKPIYLFVLISHIILAAIVLPMVLLSFYFGLTNKTEKHRRLARWTFPLWLYVAVTGVVVYVMISPYYHFK